MTINPTSFRINHYAKQGDVQTAAMLCVTFGKYCQEISSRTSSFSTKSNTSVSKLCHIFD